MTDVLSSIARVCEAVASADDVPALDAAADEAAALPDDARRIVAAVVSVARDRLRASAESRRAGRDREILFSGISHDLRNPLNTFSMSVGLLKDDVERADIDPKRAQNLVSRMERAIERMQRLIDDLQEASRADAPPVADAVVDAGALVQDAATQCAALAKERNAIVEVGAQEGQLRGDRGRLVLALTKLVGFAVRMAGEGPRVTLAASAVESGTRLSVSTMAASGVAIRAGELKGGLALLVARGIIESHGAALEIEDGARLTLSFTLRA